MELFTEKGDKREHEMLMMEVQKMLENSGIDEDGNVNYHEFVKEIMN